MNSALSLLVASLMASLFIGPLHAQPPAITTPEGARMDAADDLAYRPGQLSPAQLDASTRDLFRQNSANVFRRFPPDKAAAMVAFYTQALALRSLSPIQLTPTRQMLLTGVGGGQIKLSAGQQGDRKYDLTGGYRGGTGIRFFVLSYPDAAVVAQRFAAAGFPPPRFAPRRDGTRAAMVTDPGGFQIELVIRPGAKDGSNDGVGIGISVSDLARSRAFYRDFVGLDALPPVRDRVLGITEYPYRHGETTLYLYKAGENLPADNGSAGIQYVISDAAMADAKARHRGIAVETPLNKLKGFDLVTIWLNDPDGVTNYYAQVNHPAQPPAGK